MKKVTFLAAYEGGETFKATNSLIAQSTWGNEDIMVKEHNIVFSKKFLFLTRNMQKRYSHIRVENKKSYAESTRSKLVCHF